MNTQFTERITTELAEIEAAVRLPRGVDDRIAAHRLARGQERAAVAGSLHARRNATDSGANGRQEMVDGKFAVWNRNAAARVAAAAGERY